MRSIGDEAVIAVDLSRQFQQSSYLRDLELARVWPPLFPFVMAADAV